MATPTSLDGFLYLRDVFEIPSEIPRFNERNADGDNCPDCRSATVYAPVPPTEVESTRFYTCGDCALDYFVGENPYK